MMPRAAARVVRVLIVMCFLPWAQAGNARALVVQTLGQAFDQATEELLYSETHCVSADALTREVIYRDPQEQLIAHKVLDYTAGPMTPSFAQRNIHANNSVAVAMQGNEVVMTLGGDGGSGNVRSVSATPDADAPIVIDAGFDAFVRGHWDSLLAGQGKRLQFPVAASEALVALRIESASCSYDTQTDQCFLLELDNWLLSKVVDPIELGYDAELQRLTRFRGVANISDGSGAGMVVDIRYRYDDLAALQCGTHER